MTAILLALLASTAWGTSDFVGGTASRGRPVLGVLALMRAMGLAAIVVLVLVTSAPWVGDRWPIAALAGVTMLGGMLCLYRALAIGPMSVVAPIFATSAIVPVLWGIVHGETPGAIAFGGLAIAVAGSILAARSPGTDGAATDPRGVLFAIVAAVGLGLGLALLKEASVHAALSAVMVERAVEVLVIAVALAWSPRTIGSKLRKPGLLPFAGLIDMTAIVSFSLATRSGLLPVVAVLSSLYPVVTVVLARVLHDERLSRVQAIGATLTLLGVAVVAVSA